MRSKTLELRDEVTFIPILCVDMNPAPYFDVSENATNEDLHRAYQAQRYLLRRCGYPCDGRPNIIMTRLDGNGQATNDPYGWKDGTRTFRVAHDFIIRRWDELKDGDVVDVQFILGETISPKQSERTTSPF